VTFSVDPMDVLLPILRAGLPTGTTVVSRVPDQVPRFVPLVVIRRTGGASDYPWFYDQPWVAIQCWDGPTTDPDSGVVTDAGRNAYNLADAVRGVLWTAWRNQTVVPAGHISNIRESSAPEEINDPDVPLFVRYQATYEIRIRRNPLAP
jgi:hypothetical protein